MRRTGGHRVAGPVAAALAVLLAAGCSSSPDVPSSSTTASPSQLVTLQDGVLQERPLTGGAPARRVLARGIVDAALGPHGEVVTAARSGCTATVAATTANRHAVVLLREPTPIDDLSISPDGRALAYLTDAACSTRSVRGPGGPAEYGPNILVVRDLATGSSTRLVTRPGSGIDAVSFSPDSRRLAMWRDGAVDVLDVRTLRTVAVDRPPASCQYGQPAWTVQGVFTSIQCGSSDSVAFPQRVVLLGSRAGAPVVRSWPLPACIDGFHATTDAAHRVLLLDADVGYDRCGSRSRSVRILRLERDALTTVLDEPGGADVRAVG